MKLRHLTFAAAAAAALLVAACGGGSGTSSPQVTPQQQSGNGAQAGALSSGAITAFGSVFVNGHEFDTSHASVMDDDTGRTLSLADAALEVGQVIDVHAAANSSAGSPVADMLHLHPLVRGYVDASDTTAQTLTVMGQTVQLDSSTLFSDHRACVLASTDPCTAVTGLSGLETTTGSGSAAVPGSYVRIDGYLFSSSSGSANIVASLVSVFDESDFASDPHAFKAEGVVTAVGTSTVTIGGLTVDTASTQCYPSWANWTATACTFSVGQVVAALATAAPALPASTFAADTLVFRSQLPVETAGATLELQGCVSAVTSSPAGFTLRGVNIDASALPSGTALPVAGDLVSVVGTVAADGTTVTASSLQILRATASAAYAFQSDFTSVAAGSTADTYTLELMGQSINVDATTRLADMSVWHWFDQDPTRNPFNISTFATYLQASKSQQLIVHTAADASGNLQALSVTIVPETGVSGVAGVVDATPAPVNGTAGASTTFSIHGVAVSADPAVIWFWHGDSVAAGDEVTAVGSDTSGTLTVTAGHTWRNYIIDSGTPRQPGDDGDGF